MAQYMPQSEEDFLKMQQEAIRRVRDMQQRARQTLEDAGMHIEQPEGAEASQAQPQTPADITEENNPQADTDAAAAANAGSRPPENDPAAGGPKPHRPSSGSASSGARQTASAAGHSSAAGREEAAAHQQPGPDQEQQGVPRPHENLGKVLSPLINFSFDSEQIMLMMIVYLLYQDNADHWLLLALVYILL